MSKSEQVWMPSLVGLAGNGSRQNAKHAPLLLWWQGCMLGKGGKTGGVLFREYV